MFKILSGDFEKTAIYSCNQIIESKLNTYLYNAQDIRVLSESEIKEYIYNPDYSKYTKELEKALTGTKIVCFEYKFTNGKSFKAIADLSVFHQIQKSGKKTVDESKLTHNGKKGCLISVISIIIIFIFINTVISSNKPASNNSNPISSFENVGITKIQETNIRNILNQVGVSNITKVIKVENSSNEYELFYGDNSVWVKLNGDKVQTVETTKETLSLNQDVVTIPDKTIYKNGKIIGKVQDYVLTNKEFDDYRLYAQTYVQKNLKVPESAKFPTRSGWYIAKDKGVITVKSYVDSLNGLGLMSRMQFEVKYKNGNVISFKHSQ